MPSASLLSKFAFRIMLLPGLYLVGIGKSEQYGTMTSPYLQCCRKRNNLKIFPLKKKKPCYIHKYESTRITHFLTIGTGMVVHPLHNKAQAYRLVCPICLECSNNCCRCSLCQEFYHVKQHQPYAGMHSCFFFYVVFGALIWRTRLLKQLLNSISTRLRQELRVSIRFSGVIFLWQHIAAITLWMKVSGRP